MAFPTIFSATEYSTNSQTTRSWNPATVSCDAGDLLVWLVAAAGVRTLTTSGWNVVNAGGNSQTQSIYWKVATTTTQALSVSLNTAAACQGWLLRIKGGDRLVANTALSSTSNPNPQAFDTGSIQDYLWITTLATSTQVVSSGPADYALTRASGTASPRIFFGTREITTQTEDPSNWSVTAGSTSMANIAIWQSPPPEPSTRKPIRYSFSF